MKTLTVILEYCGGSRTDYLFDRLRSWNPGHEIEVLDNASPANRCSCVTQQNPTNTYIGGGIIDCYRLAEARECDNLFLVVNDIDPGTPIVIEQFEGALEKDQRLVQVAAAVTHDSSPHSTVYPWMVTQSSPKIRRVPHSDLLCCVIRTSFIRSFGGFPPSQGGWGYDWELAYQALLHGLHIAIADLSIVRHEDTLTANSIRLRGSEMFDVYNDRYPNSEFALQRTLTEYWRRGVDSAG
jgi:hypothetical protein